MDILDVSNTEKKYRWDAARARLIPPLVAALASIVAYFVAPSSATSSFFSTAAQIAPVPLLALAIEAKVLDRARLHGSDFARNLEWARRIADGLTLAVVILGGCFALSKLAEQGEMLSGANWVAASLVWGFVAVAALAVTGAPEPRLIATVDTEFDATSGESHVRLGVGNEYGDTSVVLRLNFLLPPEHRVDKFDVAEAKYRPRPLLFGDDKLEPKGDERPVAWASVSDIELPPGGTNPLLRTVEMTSRHFQSVVVG